MLPIRRRDQRAKRRSVIGDLLDLLWVKIPYDNRGMAGELTHEQSASGPSRRRNQNRDARVIHVLAHRSCQSVLAVGEEPVLNKSPAPLFGAQ